MIPKEIKNNHYIVYVPYSGRKTSPCTSPAWWSTRRRFTAALRHITKCGATFTTTLQALDSCFGKIFWSRLIERTGRLLYICFTIYVSFFFFFLSTKFTEPASVAQLDAPSDWRPGGRGFNSRRGRQHSFVEIDHEIFSMVILSLPLIQERQLSVSRERMFTILVNRLEDLACPVNMWLGELTALDMTPFGLTGP